MHITRVAIYNICLGNLMLYSTVHILLTALLPICMKYTARGESRVANIVQGEAECYICHETHTKSCIFHTKEAAVLYVFYCIQVFTTV